jgi:hypothetical protein
MSRTRMQRVLDVTDHANSDNVSDDMMMIAMNALGLIPRSEQHQGTLFNHSLTRDSIRQKADIFHFQLYCWSTRCLVSYRYVNRKN